MKPLMEELSELFEKSLTEPIKKSMDLGLWVENVIKENPQYADCKVWFSELTYEVVVQVPDFPNGKPLETLNDNLSRMMTEFNRHNFNTGIGTYRGPNTPTRIVPAALKSTKVKKV